VEQKEACAFVASYIDAKEKWLKP